jgi:hypothetical protein
MPFYYHNVFLELALFMSILGTTTPGHAQKPQPQDSLPAAQAPPPDTFDIKTASFFLPQPLPKDKYYQTFSILYLVPPRDWITQIIATPVLCYTGKYTLPYGFNLQGSLSTILISNRINVGPFWNLSKDNYHLAVGYQVAFNYGFLNQFGFTTKLTGWEQQPSVTLGYSFKTMAVVLRTDLYWSNGFQISEGKNVIPYTTSFINGYSLNGTLEQRLWKNRILGAGLKMYYCKYNFIAWPAFPVNSYKYWFPEFQIGLKF